MQAKSLILIVDDAPGGRDTLEALLQSPDYDLAFACDGIEALEQAEKLTPDLILLDVMMPRVDGFEVCRRLRAYPRLAEIPVILLTALDDRSSRLRGIDAGADDFITKPFDRAELCARVRTITRLNRYRRLLGERARFEWVVEQAEDGYVLLDEHDNIVYANPTARKLLQITEANHQSFMALVQQEYRCEPAEAWKNGFSQTPITPPQPMYLIRSESQTAPALWLEVTLLNQAGVSQSERLVHLSDVTTQMSTQRDMWAFHSMIMHKLNTPLHTMIGSLELLSPQSINELSTEEVGELAGLAITGVQRLSNSIHDILQYLKPPIAGYASEGFLTSELSAVIKRISRDLGLADVTVSDTIVGRNSVKLSLRAMECILWELLENAKKFHPTESPHVEVTLATEAKHAFTLRIIDNGITLSPGQIARVWAPYYQVEKYFTGEIPGMGLGLSMVAGLVWEVGGSCQLRNRDDGLGVIVELLIPFAAPQ
ncbi:MAG: response regulator [Chloroflexi bacterium]|nr:response regulator [Chloroflexota bacterium]